MSRRGSPRRGPATKLHDTLLYCMMYAYSARASLRVVWQWVDDKRDDAKMEGHKDAKTRIRLSEVDVGPNLHIVFHASIATTTPTTNSLVTNFEPVHNDVNVHACAPVDERRTFFRDPSDPLALRRPACQGGTPLGDAMQQPFRKLDFTLNPHSSPISSKTEPNGGSGRESRKS